MKDRITEEIKRNKGLGFIYNLEREAWWRIGAERFLSFKWKIELAWIQEVQNPALSLSRFSVRQE